MTSSFGLRFQPRDDLLRLLERPGVRRLGDSAQIGGAQIFGVRGRRIFGSRHRHCLLRQADIGKAARPVKLPDESARTVTFAEIEHVSEGRTAAVIGGGPAGLIAAEVLARAGVAVTVYDQMPSLGRKFLMAGRGGLNLTHSEELPQFFARYGDIDPLLKAAIEAFPPCGAARVGRQHGSGDFRRLERSRVSGSAEDIAAAAHLAAAARQSRRQNEIASSLGRV